LLASACGKSSDSDSRNRGRGNGGDVGTGGSSTGGAGDVGGDAGATGGGEGGAGSEECTGDAVGIPTRIVRLGFTQVENAVAELIGEQAASTIAAELQLPSAAQRYFPPLIDEPVITQSVWSTGDLIGQAVGRYVLENFEEVTDCGATPTDACGESFVTTFAEKAARRPLTDEERDNFLTVYSECKSFGGTVQEAVQHGVYAAIESPLFLYRFELGEPGASEPEVALSPYEMANMLSFFVTDGPPDAELLATAADGSINDADVIREQTLRLLATPAARENLDTAMLSLFGFPRIPSFVIDPTTTPGFMESVRPALMREGELFMDHVLFGDVSVFELLTSRVSFANAELAAFYGIDGFPNGEAVDADGFAMVTLPEPRSGLFTMPGFLFQNSRPGLPSSIVSRGITVRTLLACESYIFEEERPDIDIPPDATERERARIRTEHPECDECHAFMDPFGISLEEFDSVGRHRTVDERGRPVDPSTRMPPDFGGAPVANAREMAAELATSEVLAACIAKNLVWFALSDHQANAPLDRHACAVRDIERSFREGGDPSFRALVNEVASSPTLTRRIALP
jgi:hypothetical protein